PCDRRVDDAAPALSELPPVGTDDPKGPTRRDTHFGLAFGEPYPYDGNAFRIGRRRDGLMARRGKAGCVLGLFDSPQHVAVCDDEARDSLLRGGVIRIAQSRAAPVAPRPLDVAGLFVQLRQRFVQLRVARIKANRPSQRGQGSRAVAELT